MSVSSNVEAVGLQVKCSQCLKFLKWKGFDKGELVVEPCTHCSITQEDVETAARQGEEDGRDGLRDALEEEFEERLAEEKAESYKEGKRDGITSVTKDD